MATYSNNATFVVGITSFGFTTRSYSSYRSGIKWPYHYKSYPHFE